MLKTEQNTREMQREVNEAAGAAKLEGKLASIFEHGHWWVVSNNGAQWSVVDASGPGSTDGFDFEMVKDPDV